MTVLKPTEIVGFGTAANNANMAGTAAADEDDNDVPAADGPSNAHSRNRAHDEAPRGGVSMTEAFPGFTHNGPLHRK